jgi:hypothetical protein
VSGKSYGQLWHVHHGDRSPEQVFGGRPQRKEDRYREALKQIQRQVEQALSVEDRNPNRGDLMRVSRRCSEALEETK